MYHFTDGGLRNVWLVNGYTEHDTPYGPGVSIHDADGLAAAICSALTRKPAPLTGAELRYVRAAGMLMSQPALGKLIGADGQSVARWEKSGRLPRWADKLVRLVYLAHAEGSVPIRRAVERNNTVERIVGQRIVVEEVRGRWVTSARGEAVSAA